MPDIKEIALMIVVFVFIVGGITLIIISAINYLVERLKEEFKSKP